MSANITKLNENNYKRIPSVINKLLDIPSLYRHGVINSDISLSFFHSLLYLLDNDYRKSLKSDKETIVASLIKNLNTYISTNSTLKDINVAYVNIETYANRTQLLEVINEYLSKIFKETYKIILIRKTNNDEFNLSESKSELKANIKYVLIFYNHNYYEPIYQKKSSSNQYFFTSAEIKQVNESKQQSGGEDNNNNEINDNNNTSYEPEKSQLNNANDEKNINANDEENNNANDEENNNANDEENNNANQTNNNNEKSENRIVEVNKEPIPIENPSLSSDEVNEQNNLNSNINRGSITTNDEDYNNDEIIELEENNLKRLKQEEIESVMQQQSLYYDENLVYNHIFNLIYENYDNDIQQKEKSTKLTNIYMDTIKYKKPKINLKSFMPIVHMDIKDIKVKFDAFDEFKPDNDDLYNYQERYKIFLAAMMPYKYLSSNYQLLVKFDENTPAYILNMENERSSDEEVNIINKPTIVKSLYQIQLINKIENYLENREMENYYNSQFVNLIGFYSQNNENTKNYETFNINNYINQLQQLSENDKIVIYFNDFYYNRGNELIDSITGEISKKNNNILTIKLTASINYKYDENPIENLEYNIENLKINNYIIYKENMEPQYVYKKKDLLDKNILFLFDNKFNISNQKIRYINDIISFIAPKINELLYIYNDIIKNKYTFDLIEYLLEKYNLSFTNIFLNNNDYTLYSKFIENIIDEISAKKDIKILESHSKNKEIKEEETNIYANYKLFLDVIKKILENENKNVKNIQSYVDKYESELKKLEIKGTEKIELDIEKLEERGELIKYDTDIELIMSNYMYNASNYDAKIKYAVVSNITNIKNDKYIEYFKQLKEKISKNNEENEKEADAGQQILKIYDDTLTYYLNNEYLIDMDLYNLAKNNEFFDNREKQNKASAPSVFIRNNNKWIYIGYVKDNGNIDLLQLYKLVYSSYSNLSNLPLTEIEKIKNILNYYMENDNMSYLRDFYKSQLNIDEILNLILINIKNIDINIELWNQRLELNNKRIYYETVEFNINLEHIYKNIEGDLNDTNDDLFWIDLDNIEQYNAGELQVDYDTINEKYIAKNEIYDKLQKMTNDIDLKLENNEFIFMKEFIENLLSKILRTSILKYIRDKISDEDRKNVNIKELKELIEKDSLFYINKDIKLKLSENIQYFKDSDVFKSMINFNKNISKNVISFGIAFMTIYILIHHNKISSLIDNSKIHKTLLYSNSTLDKMRDIIISILINLLYNYISGELGKKFSRDDMQNDVIKRYNRILEMVVLFKRQIDKLKNNITEKNQEREFVALSFDNNWDLFRPITKITNKDTKLSKYLHDLYQLVGSKIYSNEMVKISGIILAGHLKEIDYNYDYYDNINLEYDKTNSMNIEYDKNKSKEIRLLMKNNVSLSYRKIERLLELEFDKYDDKKIKMISNKNNELNDKLKDIKNANIDNILNLSLFNNKKIELFKTLLVKIKEGKLDNSNILSELNKLQKIIEDKYNHLLEPIKSYDEIRNILRLFIEFKDFDNNKISNESVYLDLKNYLEQLLNYDMKYMISRIINNYDIKNRLRYERKQKFVINKWNEKDLDRLYKAYELKVKNNDEYIKVNKYNMEVLDDNNKQLLNKEIISIFKNINISSILSLNIQYNIIILLAIFVLLLEEIVNVIDTKLQIKDVNKREKIKETLISCIFLHIYEKLNKIIIPNGNYDNMKDKIEILMRDIKEKQKKKVQEKRNKEQEILKALSQKDILAKTTPTTEQVGNLETSVDEHSGDFADKELQEEYANMEENGFDFGDINMDEDGGAYGFVDEDDM